jgi:hypothetical protein
MSLTNYTEQTILLDTLDAPFGGAVVEASRKVAGSITDSVIGIFHPLNPSGRNTALGLTSL